MPFLNQHSGRLQNPDKFEPTSFRRNDSPVFGKKLPVGVEVIWGKLKGRSGEKDPVIPQAIRFFKDKFTAEQAKKWLDDNEIKYINFEPAKDIKESEDNGLVIDLRNTAKEYSNLKSKKDTILSESEILEDVELILREMISRGRQKFNPENWKNKSIELYTGIFKKIKEEGVKLPENIDKFLPIQEEEKHKKTECMKEDCKEKPTYEALWAEGMGHAWFCENHFKEWVMSDILEDDSIGKGQGAGYSKQGVGGRDLCWCLKCQKTFEHKRGTPCIEQKCPICGNSLQPYNKDNSIREDIDYVKEIKEGKASDKFSDNKNPNIWEELKKKLSEMKVSTINSWTAEVLAKDTDEELADRLKSIYELWTIRGAEKNDEEILNAYKVLINELKNRKIKYTPIDDFEVKESINRFTLRAKYIDKDTIKSEVCSEILIDTGKNYIEKFNLKKDILKESEIPIDFTFININTPNGKDFKEWMNYEGQIPNKENGGAIFGNLTESILNISVKDSGTFEILESEQNFRSIKFNGKLLNGYWIMELRESGWVFLKGVEKNNIKESDNISISGDFMEIKGGFSSTTINYNGQKYILTATGNGKLLLTK